MARVADRLEIELLEDVARLQSDMAIPRRVYTPGEAEKISGVSTVRQRDWRRRQIIPGTGEGWERGYGFLQVAELLVLKELSDLGIDPSRSCGFAAGLALAVGDAFIDVCDDLSAEGRFACIVGPSSRYRVFRTNDLNNCRSFGLSTFAILDLLALGGLFRGRDDRPPANKWEAEWLQRWPGNGVAVFSSGDRIAVSHSLSEPRNRDLLRDVHESSLIAVIRLKKKGYSDLSVENAQPYGIP
jgi:hypothetical protein